MDIVTYLCCICLKNDNNVRRLFNSCENLNYYSRMIVLFPEMNSTVLYNHGTMCLECCSKVDNYYKFREQCLRNSQIYINYTMQLSSASETRVGLRNDIISFKEEQKLPLERCGDGERSNNSNNLSMESSSGSVLADETCKGYTVETDKEENGDNTEMYINAEKNSDVYPNDNKNCEVIKKEIYIKTEYEVSAECEVKTGTEYTAEWENGTKDGITSDIPCTKSNIIITEEIDIKFEPGDTDECEEDELGNTSVANIVEGSLSSNPDDCSVPVSINKLKRGKMLKRHKCDKCEEIFARPANLAKHKRIHLRGKFVCQCDKKFSYMSDLTRHARIHSEEKPFKCEQCNKAFKHKESLTTHKRFHSGERPFKCDQCDKAFAQSTDLRRHKQIHSRAKPFKCDQCDKAFIQLTDLIRHKALHSGEKIFKCDECNKTFSHSAYLVKHKRIHSGEKPFKCDQCNKAFTYSSDLTKHKRIHSGEKPFKCDQCNKAFLQLTHLVSHRLVHSGEKPFKCDQCDSAFARSQNLTSHKRIHTG